MAPGPQLAAILLSIDRDRITGRERVILMKARSRLRAWVESDLYADLLSVAAAEAEIFGQPEEAMEAAAGEIQAALNLTRRSADIQMGLAYQLGDRLPDVWAALHAGSIDLARARVLCDETMHLPIEDARRIAEIALERAPRQTTGQLGARIRRLVIALGPDLAKDRYTKAMEDRRVVLEPNHHGTSNLTGLELPAADAQAAMGRINTLAKAAKSADDPRTMDQVRADVYLDLLNGRHLKQSRGRGMVDMTVELTTLAGLDDHPGDLNGYGPVIADVARQVAAAQADVEHRVTVTEHGEPIWTGITRRRPTSSQKRYVQARDRTCVFPGCRMPATECDIDHTIDYSQGGPTTPWNNAPLCRHHHRGKHKRGWKLERTAPGAYKSAIPTPSSPNRRSTQGPRHVSSTTNGATPLRAGTARSDPTRYTNCRDRQLSRDRHRRERPRSGVRLLVGGHRSRGDRARPGRLAWPIWISRA